jgi:hypothetical protein
MSTYTHTHRFNLEVRTNQTRNQAEIAVLSAFALRTPDNCEFTLNPTTVQAKAKESIAEEAKAIVEGERAKDYGEVNQSFSRIASLWSAYLGHQVRPWDVAQMMILLKVSRAKTSRKQDTLVDIIGYAECADKLEPDAAKNHP